LASEVHWNEFADAFGCVAQHVLLHLHRVKLSVRAVLLIVRSPFSCATQIANVCKVQLSFQAKFCLQIAWCHVDLSSKQYDIVHFNFFFAVADQESFGDEAALWVLLLNVARRNAVGVCA
jgi:hypothetical protein